MILNSFASKVLLRCVTALFLYLLLSPAMFISFKMSCRSRDDFVGRTGVNVTSVLMMLSFNPICLLESLKELNISEIYRQEQGYLISANYYIMHYRYYQWRN
jgi:hypothetical protein